WRGWRRWGGSPKLFLWFAEIEVHRREVDGVRLELFEQTLAEVAVEVVEGLHVAFARDDRDIGERRLGFAEMESDGRQMVDRDFLEASGASVHGGFSGKRFEERGKFFDEAGVELGIAFAGVEEKDERVVVVVGREDDVQFSDV